MRCLGWSEWGSTLTMMILNRVSGEQNFTLIQTRGSSVFDHSTHARAEWSGKEQQAKQAMMSNTFLSIYRGRKVSAANREETKELPGRNVLI
jgi:hypothetical protein